MDYDTEDSVSGLPDTEWDDLVADADAIAAEYRDAGWDAVRPAVGDVTPVTGEGFGLDILLPDSVYETVAPLVEGIEFDGSEVYSRTADGIVYVIVVNQSSADETAVIVPAFYALDSAGIARMLERAAEDGEMRTHLRALPQEELLTFVHEDPAVFVPDDSVAATLDRELVGSDTE